MYLGEQHGKRRQACICELHMCGTEPRLSVSFGKLPVSLCAVLFISLLGITCTL